MSFFRMPRWLRRMVRKRTNPMEETKALSTKSKLSILYAVLAWNALGYIVYMCVTGRKNWPVAYGIRSPEEDIGSPAQQWARALNIRNAEVIRVSGTKVSEKEKIIHEENTET